MPRFLILSWAAWIVAAEWLLPPGRASWLDVIGVAGLYVNVGLTWLWVSLSPQAVDARVRRARSAVVRLGKALALKRGVDLRGTTPVPPARIPLPHFAVVVLVGACAAVVLAWPAAFPHGLRASVVGASASLYLVGAAVLWTWAGALGAGTTYVWWLGVSDRLAADGPITPAEHRARVALPLLAITAASSAPAFMPPWVPFWVLPLALPVTLIAVMIRPAGQIRFLWRPRDGSEVYSIGSRWVYLWNFFVWVVVPLVTALLMTRAGWSAAPHGPTFWIGSVTAWLASFGTVGWVLIGPVRLLRLHAGGWSAERSTAIRFVGALPPEEVTRDLVARGFRLTEPGDRAEAIDLNIDSEAPRNTLTARRAPDGSTTWVTHPLDLLSARSLAELRAIDQRARREDFMRAIDYLMEIARSRRFTEGSGFVLAPHIWHVWALSRDTDEDDSVSIGPPYHKLLSPAVRRHCFEVFRAAAIDLVFIQDGVDAPAVRKVLIQLFEHFDLWGAQPIEERHFRWVPGVRVLVHDLGPSAGWKPAWTREGYREPDYDDVARARILHVMVDRGGHGDAAPDPSAPDERPVVADPPLVGAPGGA